jgi:hypothetical protein
MSSALLVCSFVWVHQRLDRRLYQVCVPSVWKLLSSWLYLVLDFKDPVNYLHHLK